jgi:GcrA cell cycle regulator
MTWNATSIDRLRDLAAQGQSTRQIAVTINSEFGAALSRNAVIGRARRSGIALSCRQTGAQEGGPRTSRRRPATAQLARPALSTKPAIVMPAPAPDTARAVTIWRLRTCHCRFPLWKTPSDPRLYCGMPTAPASSWCASHQNTVFRRS